MDQKIKFVMLGLGVLLLISLISLFSAIGSKQVLMREYISTKETLTKENEALALKVNTALEEKKRAEDRLEEIQKDLDRVAKEEDEIHRKYDTVVRERAELIEKLKYKKPVVEEAKVTAVTEDVYWAKILREKTDLEMQVANLRNEINSLRITQEQSKRDKATMELEIKNLNRDKQELEGRIVYNDKLIDSLSSELVREKNLKRQLQDGLSALKGEHNILLRQIKTLNNQKASLETRLKETETAKKELDKQIREMNEMLDYKLSQVMDVKKELQQLEGQEVTSTGTRSSIELPPIIVRSETPASTERYTGNVVAVNKENNFIIIDLGEENGLKPGVNFDVYHDNTKVATVEVIQIRENVSACDIKQASGPIKVGDVVR